MASVFAAELSPTSGLPGSVALLSSKRSSFLVSSRLALSSLAAIVSSTLFALGALSTFSTTACAALAAAVSILDSAPDAASTFTDMDIDITVAIESTAKTSLPFFIGFFILIKSPF